MASNIYPKITQVSSAPIAVEMQTHPLPLIMVTDFDLSAEELSVLPEQVDGKVIRYTETTFANRALGDVLGLNQDCKCVTINVANTEGRLWISRNIRAIKAMPNLLVVTDRSARQPWIQSLVPKQIMKRKDLPIAERLIDTLGELIPFLHITPPAGLLTRIFRVLWSLVCKTDTSRS